MALVCSNLLRPISLLIFVKLSFYIIQHTFFYTKYLKFYRFVDTTMRYNSKKNTI